MRAGLVCTSGSSMMALVLAQQLCSSSMSACDVMSAVCVHATMVAGCCKQGPGASVLSNRAFRVPVDRCHHDAAAHARLDAPPGTPLRGAESALHVC